MDPLLYNLNDRKRPFPGLDQIRRRVDRVDRSTARKIEETLKILDSMQIIKAWFSELNQRLGYKTIEDLIRYMVSNRLYGRGMIDKSFIWSETEQGHGYWHDANSIFNAKWDNSGIGDFDFDYDFI